MTPLVMMSGELECPPVADAPSAESMQESSSMRQLSADELRAVSGGPVVQNDSR